MTTIATTTEMEIICCFSDAPIAFRNFRCCQAAAGQCQSPESYEAQSQIARRVRALDLTRSNFVSLVLKELVNREPETDH